ncbi:hypothetical protein [Curtobacterium sp. MCBD17_040]|uniref:hypothetical protein n=1 Tax=Curtobacterium sp. MCBD17_040 TaxID=2175674 RepID=UPI0015E893A9|nr:hypothetical protein [Curtobacterium sp. MCBD17_040]WIB65759.1 hypothetical protein DEI94_16710 [Curtobacterium sp. MCBD17_040]
MTGSRDPMVDEVDKMIRRRRARQVDDDELRDWVDAAMGGWRSPLALQGAHLLNDHLLTSTRADAARFDKAFAWWERELAAYDADSEAWDRRYWLRYLQGLATVSVQQKRCEDPAATEAAIERRVSGAHRGARRSARQFVIEGLISRTEADTILTNAGLEWWDGVGRP